ncbi:tRNA(Ile)-lysidine synthase [Evansella caseinilytica]|uniref:tRNA(Ile)-lysidine synthase n=1 Tax=Evansella caseinilytica TaxID=1503961 RepID=A0A1H3UV44_9BACI|nr:tRNA lysidine(34) synthetase TilS [Evansella caseinilytica]SDZ66293.1 tRNA(Ile)-lysidine synthase [Evansella caseinilytica]
MNQTVNDFIEKHRLIAEDDHLLVAVSGGPDSMALLHFLTASAKPIRQISVCHVEHGLRGESSIGDLHFVQSYCGEKNIPFYFSRPDVNKCKKERGMSTQEAARACRYEYFEQLMKKLKASKIALAHHGDDQVETVLMRQVRGSLSGLKGIPVQRPFAGGQMIRPFLCVEKNGILQYCSKNRIPYRKDESNESDVYQRNRFRKILPFLKQENPKVHEVIQRQSEQLEAEDALLQQLAEEALKEAVVSKTEQLVILKVKHFLNIPIALQRRCVHLILNYLSQDVGQRLSVRHQDDILALLRKDLPSGSIHLPKGLRVEKSYDQCFFSTEDTVQPEAPDEKKQIPIPGMVRLKQGKIVASLSENDEESAADPSVFLADIRALSTPLFVRRRKPGDRIAQLGLKGTKKVKDIFIDEKIPKHDRQRWPVIVDHADNILWLPGVRRSNIALVHENSEQILKLVYYHDGGGER